MRAQLALALGVLVLAGRQAPSSEEIYSWQCLAGCRAAKRTGDTRSLTSFTDTGRWRDTNESAP